MLKKIRLARQSERQREASLREMRLLASLDHPNILRYKEAWLEKGCVVCIVTSYCDGGDLMSLLQRSRGRYFRQDILQEWFVQAALALVYIHKQRVLHRDIKSGNILLHNGMLQLADFGLAKKLKDGEKFSKTQVGTPNYMCPELLQEKPYNHKSDVWSLGCVMYELTALRPAFQAFNINGLINKIIKGSLPPMPSDYSPEWRSLVRSMLHKNPNERPELEDLLKHDFLKDTIRQVNERIRQERMENPRDPETSEPPNITPQDLKKILRERQEKDYARVERHAGERRAREDRRNRARAVSGRVGGAGSGRRGMEAAANPSRQPSGRVRATGGDERTPSVRPKAGLGLGDKLDPLSNTPGMSGVGESDSSRSSASSFQLRYSGRGGVQGALRRREMDRLAAAPNGRLPPMFELSGGRKEAGGMSGDDISNVKVGGGVGRTRVLPPPLTPLNLPGGGIPLGHASPRQSSIMGTGSPVLNHAGALRPSRRSRPEDIDDSTDLAVTIRKMEARVRSARRDLGLGPGAADNVSPVNDGVDRRSSIRGSMRGSSRRLSGLGPGGGTVKLPRM